MRSAAFTREPNDGLMEMAYPDRQSSSPVDHRIGGINLISTAAMHNRIPRWVTGCLHDYVGITTGVPQIADDLLQRPSRQSRPSRPREFHPEPLTDSGREPLD